MADLCQKQERLKDLWRPCLAEFIGSLVLLFFCCAPLVADGNPPAVRLLHSSLSSAAVVSTVVWSFAHISGAHLNPSLSLALLITGLLFCLSAFLILRAVLASCVNYKHVTPMPSTWSGDLSLLRTLLYIPSQCAGGVAGAIVLKLATPFKLHNSTTLGLSAFNPELTHPAQAVFVEVMLTFTMVLPIYAGMDRMRLDRSGSVALTVGLQVAGGILAGAFLSGSSMNPIRALGPSVAVGRYSQLWVYILGPTIGACFSGLVYRGLFATSAHSQVDSTYEETKEKALDDPNGEAINLTADTCTAQ